MLNNKLCISIKLWRYQEPLMIVWLFMQIKKLLTVTLKVFDMELALRPKEKIDSREKISQLKNWYFSRPLVQSTLSDFTENFQLCPILKADHFIDLSCFSRAAHVKVREVTCRILLQILRNIFIVRY